MILKVIRVWKPVHRVLLEMYLLMVTQQLEIAHHVSYYYIAYTPVASCTGFPIATCAYCTYVLSLPCLPSPYLVPTFSPPAHMQYLHIISCI